MKTYLTRVLQGYLEACAFFEGDENNESFESFEFSTTVVMTASSGIKSEQLGHDFWLTRARMGVGFWDRGLGERGVALTALADRLGQQWVYLGDDGFLYFSKC